MSLMKCVDRFLPIGSCPDLNNESKQDKTYLKSRQSKLNQEEEEGGNRCYRLTTRLMHSIVFVIMHIFFGLLIFDEQDWQWERLHVSQGCLAYDAGRVQIMMGGLMGGWCFYGFLRYGMRQVMKTYQTLFINMPAHAKFYGNDKLDSMIRDMPVCFCTDTTASIEK